MFNENGPSAEEKKNSDSGLVAETSNIEGKDDFVRDPKTGNLISKEELADNLLRRDLGDREV